ncbi:hypothetical protein SARC_05590 [Sphaeroforma arctica JP610]|uniref:Uncharacterized protein n=1 Tax=Sphaeroforma arctica JP610 TaxID=667725 RepID=A0A0L0FZY1_9EUKA|nr:hypothetical protein SARC_05590 [Sphaeroforma arctica JP610]KNC82121.1 hypothetical protein SARC_05590 [Sphaeroforma arctica JP610]|eukprot:XP_014156023.1 hypothetical protein SARC_05590 [Sphaeroforma arctica JP610]
MKNLAYRSPEILYNLDCTNRDPHIPDPEQPIDEYNFTGLEYTAADGTELSPSIDLLHGRQPLSPTGVPSGRRTERLRNFLTAPALKNRKKLVSLLVMLSWWSGMIPQYARTMDSLTRLTKKNSVF